MAPTTNPYSPALPGPSQLGLSKRELFALAAMLFHGLDPYTAVKRADVLIEALNQ